MLITYYYSMDVIPPSNLQNQQNLNTNQSIPTPENQAAESHGINRIFDFVRMSLFEVFLVALFSVLLLATFNYFNLIPLSSILPALSFLPQSNNQQNNSIYSINQDDVAYFSNNFQNLSSCNLSNKDNNILLNQLIKCTTPQRFVNTSNKISYSTIPNSDQQGLIGGTGLQINLSLKVDSNGKDDLGLIFGGDPTQDRLYLTYYPSQNVWGVQFLLGDKVTDLTPIYYSPYSSNSQRAYFSLRFSGYGKTLSILFPNGDMEVFHQEKSFYTKYNNLPITTLIPKKSAITIYSLNYYTPQ